jgi:uncharacterized protein
VASAAESFFAEFRRKLSESKELSDADKQRMGSEVDKAVAREPVPTIAIIGEAGVGKTTTLNALFNAGAVVGHSRPTTKTADGFQVEISDHHGNKGDIQVVDMPGLGESIAKAEELRELYERHLSNADVILWVHPAFDRMLEFSQRKVAEIFREKLGPLADHLVFGLNKADDMYPKNWRYHANVPSEEQFKHLEDAERHFADLMRKVLPHRSPLRVTTYSALQFYNLPRLFSLLMEAMPKKRRWVLEQRMDLANFIQKADPRFVAGIGGAEPDSQAARRAPAREWILAQMTEAELRAMVLQGLPPEEWWQRKGNR